MTYEPWEIAELCDVNDRLNTSYPNLDCGPLADQLFEDLRFVLALLARSNQHHVDRAHKEQAIQEKIRKALHDDSAS